MKNRRREGKNVAFRADSKEERKQDEINSPSPSPTRRNNEEEDKFDDYESSDDDLTGVTIKGAA